MFGLINRITLYTTLPLMLLNCEKETISGNYAPGNLDCFGTDFGAALIDSCGICAGGETGLNFNYALNCNGICFAEIQIDCNGDCDGSSVNDCCGECNGNGECDVCGTCNGAINDISDCMEPGDFQFDQSTVQGFYFFANVLLGEDYLDSVDWIGAFKETNCVGSRIWNTDYCLNNICDIGVMGNDGNYGTNGYMESGEIPSFKIYDYSNSTYFDAEPSGNVSINTEYCEEGISECLKWGNLFLILVDTLKAIIP